MRSLPSVWGVLWVRHDNNHFVNSAWLWWVGPAAPPLVARALSIALGTLTVPVAAVAARGDGPRDRAPVAAVVAALLFALSYPFVNYGSEARGYVGLVLFTLLALLALDRSLAGRSPWAPVGLGAAMALGFASHLTMAATALALPAATWFALRSAPYDRPPAAAVREMARIWAPSAAFVAPIALLVVFGGPVQVGMVDPFTLAGFVEGTGGGVRYTLGLPRALPAPIALGVAAAVVWAHARWCGGPRRWVYAIGIGGLPALLALAHLPNAQHARYYLVSLTLLLLCLAEVVAAGLVRPGRPRWVAGGALALALVGATTTLAGFLTYGRGAPTALVAAMVRDGQITYGTADNFRTPLLVDHAAAELGATVVRVPRDRLCDERPPFLLVEAWHDAPPERLAWSCPARYVLAGTSMPFGLSGIPWALYAYAP